jgi:adenylosuccinate synthase
MTKVFFVAGLGFGDEGKGTTVDYLVKKHKAGLVVRYNGGAQAAHNVICGGVHHTFSQFGSGTFHGAKTYLSKYMLVDLPALVKEGETLTKKIGSSAFDLLNVDQEALLVTPYHKAANQLHELVRGRQKHGTCGMGIGEARQDFLFRPEISPVVKDLLNPKVLGEKLSEIKDLKLRTFQCHDLAKDEGFSEAFNLLLTPVEDVVNRWVSLIPTRIKITDQQFLKEFIDSQEATVFEGAQGVLLDETYGFHPHVTWTNTTFDNALDLLSGGGVYDLEKIGVMRTYMTRHGEGPFPTRNVALASALDIKDKHNSDEGWQGQFVTGSLDLVLIKYALGVLGGVNSLSITHMDHLKDPPAFMKKVCVGYSIHAHSSEFNHLYVDNNQLIVRKIGAQNEQMNHQQQLTYRLSPGTCWPAYWPVNESNFEGIITDLLKTRIGIRSFGPRFCDKNP